MGNTTTEKSKKLFEQLGDNRYVFCNDAIDHIRTCYNWHIYVAINPRTTVGGIWAWEAYNIDNAKEQLYAPKNEESYEDAQREAIQATLEVLVKNKEQREEERRHQELIKSGEFITRKEAENIMSKALHASMMYNIDGDACEHIMKVCKEILYHYTKSNE